MYSYVCVCVCGAPCIIISSHSATSTKNGGDFSRSVSLRVGVHAATVAVLCRRQTHSTGKKNTHTHGHTRGKTAC